MTLSTAIIRVRRGTNTPGMMQEITPSAAKGKPRAIISHVLWNGPMGVLPEASIWIARIITRSPSWALPEKGISPRFTGTSSTPRITMKTPVRRIIALSIGRALSPAGIFAAWG